MWDSLRVLKVISIASLSLGLGAVVGLYALLFPVGVLGYMGFNHACKIYHVDRQLQQYSDLFHTAMENVTPELCAEEIARTVAQLRSKTIDEKVDFLANRIRLLQEATWSHSANIRIASAKAIFAHDRPLSPSLCILFETMATADLVRRKGEYMARMSAGLDTLAEAAGVPLLAGQVAAIQKLRQGVRP